MSSVRVILVEDHNLVRAGLRLLLQKVEGIEVVGEADNGKKALTLAEELKPDLILMDIAMPELNGLEATRQLKETTPQLRIIILSMHTNKEYVWQALHVGANGYLIKDAEIEELQLAIRTVMQDQLYLSPFILKHVVSDYLSRVKEPSTLDQLSQRQRHVLQLIAEGYTTREIAEKLQIAPKTAETHRTQLMEQLGIHDIAGLVRYAVRMGIISSD